MQLRVLIEGLPLMVVTVAVARYAFPSTSSLTHLDLATAVRLDRLVSLLPLRMRIAIALRISKHFMTP
jgi:hypothetical protein